MFNFDASTDVVIAPTVIIQINLISMQIILKFDIFLMNFFITEDLIIILEFIC